MKKMKRIGLVALVIAFLLMAVSCGAPQQEASSAPAQESASAEPTQVAEEPAPQQDEAMDTAWINSDIAGNVTAETVASEKDDFHVAVNKDWLAEDNLGSTLQVSAFTERNEEVMAQMMALIGDETQTSHEAKLVQKFYNDFIDMDARNARGMEPVMPMIERIEAIETLDDLTAYMAEDEDRLASPPLSVEVGADWKDSTQNTVFVSSPSFSLADAGEYESMTEVGKRTKAATEVLFKKLLARVGYTDEEAAAAVEDLFAIEEKIAAVSMSEAESQQEGARESMYNPVTSEELAELSPNFPILAFLKNYTDAGVDRFILQEPEWLSGMNEIYTEENIEGFKAWLLYNTLNAAASLLDQECMDIMLEYNGSKMAGGTVEVPLEQMAYATCSTALNMAMGKMYVENYVTPETKQEIEEMVDEVVGVYRTRLQNNDWLGDETKQKAIEKLDSLKTRVAYPDDWSLYDYSDLDFPEDGGIFDDMLALRHKGNTQNTKKATSPADANIWSKAPQDVGAYYRTNDNSINIPAGILGGAFYDPQSSVEEQMGGIGMVIGHEITHAFDSNMGSQFDKDGNLANWWTEEDHAAFKERTDKVAAYFDSIETLPGVYVDGNRTIGETVADLGGMSCMLEIAKGMEDFDYEAFFSSFAKVWKTKEAQEMAEYLLQTDVHAPGYVRTNATVQQYQEFYDAFGVVEGDGMYLAPEERLAVW